MHERKEDNKEYNTETLILRNNNFLRIASVLLVVIYHSMLTAVSEWYPAITRQVITGSGRVFLITFLQVLNSIHVPVLFIVSGYTFCIKMTSTDDYNNKKVFLRKKTNRLLVPYLLYSLLWDLPVTIITRSDTLLSFVQKLFMGNAQYWYILYLFLVFIAVRYTWEVYSNKYVLISVILILSGISQVTGLDASNIVHAFLFFSAGILFCKCKIVSVISEKKIWLLVLGVISIGTIVYRFIRNQTDIKMWSLVSPFLGIFVFLALQTCFIKHPPQRLWGNKIYSFLKKYGYFLYLIHQQIIVLIMHFISGNNIFLNIFIAFIYAAGVPLMAAWAKDIYLKKRIRRSER